MDKYQLFARLQMPMLFLANNQLGRKYLGIAHEVKPNQKILRLTSNSYVIDKGNKVTQIFRGYDLFGKKLALLLKVGSLSVGSLFSTHPEAGLLLPMLVTDNVFSGAGDGIVRRTGQASWAAAHDDTAGTAADATSTTGQVLCQPSADGGWRIDRGFLPFDTSTLPDGITIDSATLNIMLGSKTDNVSGVTIDLITTTQASNTTLEVADFDQVGTTEQATALTIASMAVDVYSIYTLNATGIGNISLTGFSQFGLRTSHDTDNSACTNAATNTSAASFYLSEQSGTLQDPYLAITYPSSTGLQAKIW